MKNDYSITAEFAKVDYQLNLTSGMGGNVTEPGEGTFGYTAGTKVQIKAESNADNHFTQWSGNTTTIENTTSRVTNITMKGNYDIKAEFELDFYNLNITSTNGGNVTKPGEGDHGYYPGRNVTLEAIVTDQDYHFARWKGDNSTIGNTSSNKTYIMMEEDYSVTAVFEKDIYELTVNSTKGGNVTVPGEGSFNYTVGTEVDLEAKKEPFYHFVGWTGENGTIVDPGSNQTTITMDGSYTITAKFEIDTYELTIDSTIGGNVTVPGEGTYEYNATKDAHLEAIADSDHHFVEWKGENGTITDTKDNTTTITMKNSYNITAEFALTDYTLTIDSTSGGKVIDPGEGTFGYSSGQTVNLNAEPHGDYHFVRWEGENGTIADTTSNSTTITIENNHSITAVFEINRYNLTIDSTVGGNVTAPGEGTFQYNASETVDLEAVSEEYYHFVRWSGDNSTIGDTTSNSTMINMESDHSITAEFEIDTHNLSIDSTSGGQVEVPGEGTFKYEHGTILNLEAVSDEYYHFVRWSGDNSTIANKTDNSTTIQMNNDYSITTKFDLDTYQLTINSTVGGNVTVPGEGTFEYEAGKQVHLEAIPESNYSFVRWTGDNGTIEKPGDNITSIAMKSSYNITAKFATSDHYLTIKSTSGGSVIKPGEGTFGYLSGESVEIRAAPSENYRFIKWKGENGTVMDPGSKTTTIEMTGNYSITAVFVKKYDVKVEMPSDGIEKDTGPHRYAVNIKNQGSLSETFELSAYCGNPDWNANIKSNVTIDAGSSKDVVFEVDIPDRAGYEESSKVSVSAVSKSKTEVNDQDSMNLTYRPQLALQLHSPGDKTVQNSSTYSFDFVLENTGGIEDTYKISVSSSNSDWLATSQDSVSVRAGGKRNVTVDITVPEDVTDLENSTIELTAVSSFDRNVSKSASMKVVYEKPEKGFIHIGSPSDKTVLETGDHIWNFVIENENNEMESFELSSSSGAGWDTQIGDSVIELGADSSKEISVTVTIPETAESGANSSIKVTAVSRDDRTVSDSDYMILTYDPDAKLGVKVQSPKKEVQYTKGDLSCNFTVVNTGNAVDTYELITNSTKSGWNVSSQDQVRLASGKSKEVTVKIKLPDNIKHGNSSMIELKAVSSADGSIRDSAVVVINYEGRREMSINVKAPEDRIIESGGIFYLGFTVENTGDLTGIFDLNVSSEKEWDVSLNKSSLELSRDGSKTVDVRVTVPETIKAGTSVYIRMRAVCRSNESVNDTAKMVLSKPSKRQKGVKVTSPGSKVVKSTGSFIYEFTVKNTGEVDTTFELSVTADKDWDVSLDSSSIYISSGESVTVDVEIKVPGDVDDGGDNLITLKVKSEDGSVSDSASMDIQYNKSKDDGGLLPSMDTPLIVVILLSLALIYCKGLKGGNEEK